MYNVNSLRTGIFSEIFLVLLPLTALLLWQTVNDISNSDKVAGVYRLHTASSDARQKYTLFVNGVVDAVDSGRVSGDAINHLDTASRKLLEAGEAGNNREFRDLAIKIRELHSQVRNDRTLKGLIGLRAAINGIDAELAALDVRCEEASRGIIQSSIDSAQQRKKLVFAALALGGVATIWLISLLIRHIRQFEVALRSSEERMRVMFESVNAGIVLVDCETKSIVDANPAAIRMYGGEKEELIGCFYSALFQSGDESVCLFAADGESIDISKGVMRLRHGGSLPILTSISSVTVDDRRCLLESFVDLTEQLALENELVAARDAAESASRAKSIFLANMSHEIRTPMNAILGYSQLLRRDVNLTPRQGQSLDIINRSGEHLLKLLNDILEMSKIEAGVINLVPTCCKLGELLKEMGTLFAGRIRQKGVGFGMELVGEFPAALNLDEGKVRQVVINLLSNALKFTDRGMISLRASVACDGPHPVTVTVDVEDTGSGIAPEEFGKVFTSFEQTESGRRMTGGTGLGMPISRRFARLMGGDVVIVRSSPGSGSLFRFTFRAEVAGDGAAAPPSHGGRRVRSLADGKECRILVVDDQETNRLLLSDILGRAGFKVQDAESGAEGIARSRSWNPDIILMDIMMPEMDGVEAMKRIKAISAKPVIAVTASVIMEDCGKFLDLGFDGFVMKPVQMENLFEEIQKVVGIDYLYDELGSHGEEVQGLTAIDLVAVPENLLVAMGDALDYGDTKLLRELIDRIGELDRDIAAALRLLVDSYAYDTLSALIAKALPPPAKAAI